MRASLTFSRSLKEELSTLKIQRPCCRKAELHAFLKVAGYLLVGSEFSLCAHFRNSKIAQRVYKFLKETYNTKSNIVVLKNNTLYKSREYRLLLNYKKEMDLLLQNDVSENFIIHYFKRRKCCLASYIRGIFLHCGYMTNPERSYHVEFNIEEELWARQIIKILSYLGMKRWSITQRKKKFVIYNKNCSDIEKFLVTIGSATQFLHLENIIIYKQTKNSVNRKVNCETGNISRQIKASYRQIEAINFLINKNLFDILNDNIKKLALLRLENAEMSAKDLSQILNIPRSVFNYRMRKIIQLYEKYKPQAERGIRNE